MTSLIFVLLKLSNTLQEHYVYKNINLFGKTYCWNWEKNNKREKMAVQEPFLALSIIFPQVVKLLVFKPIHIRQIFCN